MTADISPNGLMSVYEVIQVSPRGKVVVKLSIGEPGSNYLRTDLIADLVQSLNASIVECNTAFGGSRANTAMHYQVAEAHGYTEIANVDIMDEDGSMTLSVTGGSNLTESYVGANFANYDYYVVLSHFKGHSMAGYGGAIKNISIGIASPLCMYGKIPIAASFIFISSSILYVNLYCIIFYNRFKWNLNACTFYN